MAVLTGVVVAIAIIVLFHWINTRWFSFPAQSPEDYADGGPRFDIRHHLSGPLICEGVIYGPTGRVTSRFVADFEITWDGDDGVMAERFTYDSGEIQVREWRLTLVGSDRIEARADDVAGVGIGRQMGPAVQLRYRLKLDAADGGHVLSAVDWMYLAPNGTIVNRSQFRKFGIKVAELVATMRRREAA